jgi:lipopolysaccharide exporter
MGNVVIGVIRRGLNPSFIREVMLLVGGTAMAQVLAILCTPLLTRVYGPVDFGVYATYSSLLSILAVPVCLRYELAIPLPQDEDEAFAVLVVSLTAAILVSLVIFLVVWRFAGPISSLLKVEPLRPYLWMLSIGLLGTGIYRALNYWATRKQRFVSVSRTKVTQVLAQSIVQVGLGSLTHSVSGLLIGDVIGRSGGSTSMGWTLLNKDRQAWKTVRLRTIHQAARRYLRFPLISTWASLLNALSLQLPLLLINALFTTTVAGWYSLSYRVLAAPITLIGQAVGQVFYARAARAQREPDQLRQLTTDVATFLLAAGLPAFSWVTMVGPRLFTLAFGTHWTEAGVFAQVLSPWFMFWIVSNPLSNLLFVRGWQGLNLGVTVLEALTRVGSVLLGRETVSPLWALVCLSASGLMVSWISLYIFLKAARASILAVLTRYLWLILATLPFCVLHLASAHFLASGAFCAASLLILVANYVVMYVLVRRQVGDIRGWRR